MDLNRQDYLEELLGLRRDNTWDNAVPFTETIEDFIFSNNDWKSMSWDGLHTELEAINLQNSFLSTEEFSGQGVGDFCYSSLDIPFADQDSFCAAQITDSSQNTFDTPPFHIQEDYNSFGLVELEEPAWFAGEKVHYAGEVEAAGSLKVESGDRVFSIGRKNGRGKKIEGQPSKNLMAERRRRKRLNDRLSMLRSIVPNISKMDRTSILGDTIEYVKELLGRIKSVQQEIEADECNINFARDVKPNNQILIRNSPKFEVERRSGDTRIEVCCGGKPGLLLSTVNTLEALGLEIQECVISCFNDFAMRASCSEESQHTRVISCEDIKQELFRNAGYGGRCL